MSDHLKLKLATALEDVSELRSKVWQAERIEALVSAQRDDARAKLRALVEATDALDLAARLWMDGDRPTDEALDAAKDAHEAALAAARGAL